MSALANADAQRVLVFLADWRSPDGGEASIAELVGRLGTLVEADWIGYSEHDWVRRRSVAHIAHPPFWRSMESHFWEHVADSHPIRRALSLVACGMTNADVAELLWLAPSTVRKHPERVYAKLGVTTRTAAVARVFGPIDAEAS